MGATSSQRTDEMISGIGKSLLQFFDPGTWGVIILSVMVTALIFVLLFFGAQMGLAQIPEFGWGWMNDATRVVSSLLLIVALVFFLLPVSAITLGFFVEVIANRVEDRWYGGRGDLRDPPIREMVFVMARFFTSLIVFNLLALPIYIFFPLFNIPVFLLLNGTLVGREYFEMVALRHWPPAEVKQVRARNRFKIFMTGIVITVALLIPIVNFFAPVFGASLMVHTYKRIASNA